MIETKHLVRKFGHRMAVDDVSFSVAPGTILGFLGPNGAGKTTTIRMIAGSLPPTSGTAQICGIDVQMNPVAAQKKIGYMPESTPLYHEMTVFEFLKLIAEIRGFRGRERGAKADATIERCFLQPVRNQPIETLSKGYRQRTCLAQAILHDPPILLLDEPTEGLDPNQKKIVRDMLREMSANKVILQSTHVLEEVNAVCNRVIIISGGKLLADDTPQGLKKKSPSYNSVRLQTNGDSKAARKEVMQLANVRHAKIVREDSDRFEIEIFPKDGDVIAPSVMALAQDKGWPVRSFETDTGRLDEIFRTITTTEDSSTKQKEAV